MTNAFLFLPLLRENGVELSLLFFSDTMILFMMSTSSTDIETVLKQSSITIKVEGDYEGINKTKDSEEFFITFQTFCFQSIY